ncbi:MULTISPECIES: MBL fold metallo-hydrolase [unclassified Fusibacter]|uniref:MBL fold metallo-hydrolase n=1 Tax=unclassified Fusibacter TaxID=2624464 RepID=UPI0013E9952A|nr:MULTISPECIES: MBL fold metallo-hydrolase [unclassified Fusibacter]MCK8060264.1 MBL fold metallo-hydrolase [Fusibacter sp. A2]NPE20447.1 MBL fold metallo-hydrolase [Fusibacter sp. A1]
MKRIMIEENMIAYQHSGETEKNFGYNIYAFLDGQEALILDTAYSKHLTEVIKDLSQRNIKITAVLPSHYHPDHFEGIRMLEDVRIYGTQESLKTIEAFELTKEEYEIYAPTHILKDKEILTFGEHRFEFQLVKGHSECSMFILINDKYLHIGDT